LNKGVNLKLTQRNIRLPTILTCLIWTRKD